MKKNGVTIKTNCFAKSFEKGDAKTTVTYEDSNGDAEKNILVWTPTYEYVAKKIKEQPFLGV